MDRKTLDVCVSALLGRVDSCNDQIALCEKMLLPDSGDSAVVLWRRLLDQYSGELSDANEALLVVRAARLALSSAVK